MNLETLTISTEKSKIADYSVSSERRRLLYNGIYINNKRMVKGNFKLKDILIFDLPAVKSCLNCSSCAKTCYAKKAQEQYPNVMIFRDTNFYIYANDKDLLKKLIVLQLSEAKEKTVRLHSSGDFFSQSYINFWSEIISMFPNINFYTYTKVEEIFNFSDIEKNNNFNLIPSFIDGKLNYGSLSYVKEMKAKYGSYICPATLKDGVKCGRDCNYCVSGKNVVFVEH